MIGYHYTTKEAWEQIKYEGMLPATMNEHEWNSYAALAKGLPRKAIWVWQKTLSDKDTWIVTATLSCTHNSFNIVLLEVEYEPEDAGSIVHYQQDDSGLYVFKCNFSLGKLETPMLPIELLINPISPDNIELIWETDLLASVYGRHDVCLI